MLSVKNLTKIYETSKGVKTTALDNLTINFCQTGFVFILGKSGSGKSTFLNLLGGVDQPTDGEIIVKGKSSKNFSAMDFDNYRNTCIGFVFQEYNLIDTYSVEDNIKLALELQGRKYTREDVDMVLRLVDLTDNRGNTLFNRKINELSGGQKQRVAIARALIKNPEIILADEPTGALDSKTSAELYELLKKLSEKRLVIVVSHDYESALRYGDRIVELSDGKIINDSYLNEVPNEKTTDECHFIKSKLPFKRALLIGVHGLSSNPVRLAISILLAVVAFTLFGFSFTASMVNEYRTELTILRDNDFQMIIVEADNKYYGHNGLDYLPFAEKQLNIIKEFNNGKEPMTVISPVATADWSELNLGETKREDSNSVYCRLALSSSTCIEIDSVTGDEDAKLEPDKRFKDKDICRLPQTYDEVAITDMHADMFIRFGYKTENGETIRIQTPDELIGKKLGRGNLTICGVFSTELNREYYKQYDDISMETLKTNDPYNADIVGTSVNSVISFMYLKKGFSESLHGYSVDINRLVLKLSGNENADLKLFNKLNYTEESGREKSVKIQSPYSGLMSPLYFFRDYLLLPFQIGATVFAVFAALLMMNFLNTSFECRKKELGILRALGARKKDILCICMTESGIIALIDFSFSLIAVSIICGILNTIYFIPLFIVGFLSIISMLGICFGAVAISAILPVFKLVKKTPIDIINKK